MDVATQPGGSSGQESRWVRDAALGSKLPCRSVCPGALLFAPGKSHPASLGRWVAEGLSGGLAHVSTGAWASGCRRRRQVGRRTRGRLVGRAVRKGPRHAMRHTETSVAGVSRDSPRTCPSCWPFRRLCEAWFDESLASRGHSGQDLGNQKPWREGTGLPVSHVFCQRHTSHRRTRGFATHLMRRIEGLRTGAQRGQKQMQGVREAMQGQSCRVTELFSCSRETACLAGAWFVEDEESTWSRSRILVRP